MKKSFPFSTKIFCFLAIFCFYFQGAQALNWSENQTMKVDSSGNIVAVWQSYDQINEVYVIQSSYYDTTSATWSSVSTISDTTINSFSPVVASNSAGDVVVLLYGPLFVLSMVVFPHLLRYPTSMTLPLYKRVKFL